MENKSFLYRLFIEPTASTGKQMFRYFMFGGISSVVDIGLLALLRACFGDGLLLLWTAIAFIANVAVSYLTSIKWTFSQRNASSQGKEISVFFLIAAGGFAWTEFLMWLFAIQCGMNPILAKVIIILLVYFWNFFMKKHFLFRNEKK